MTGGSRICRSCGTANEDDARFCEGCGTALARVCGGCGTPARPTARFCRGCGAALDGVPASAAEPNPVPAVRKSVTVMFADLAGSTTFEERVDVETAREVLGCYHDLLRTTAARHRAGLTKYIGDGFMAVWGVPETGPDDAMAAVEAAIELRQRFIELAADVMAAHGAELALRVAVNTGEVVVSAEDADLVGDALNVGARLEAHCPPGEVVVGEETWRATRGRHDYESLGRVRVKGRTAPVTGYRWLRRRSDTADPAPFVGRGEELRRLQAVRDDAIRSRVARLVTVIGDPGVGKSRLAAEFAAAQGDSRLLRARCDAEATVALAALVDLLRARDIDGEIDPGTPERERLLRALTGLADGVPGSVEENFWALRRYIEVLARDRPVVLILDDLQWADTLLLDFIEHLLEWLRDAPVLVLALARPELRELRADFVTANRWDARILHLGGLDAGATAELAAKVLGAERLPDELVRRLPSSTGGNPLFVRELIGMLAHDGVLVAQAAGWRLTIDVDAIEIPPTIQALLASRLERLDPADRRVLEIAAVVGGEFPLGAVRALSGQRPTIELSLNRLRRLEVVEPSGSYLGDEPVWRFHHVLIRDVAYRRLLKSERAELHERLADWVLTDGAGVTVDPDEIAGRHREAAHTYRRELDLIDAHTADLALRSARHYAASARRALDRDELISAGTRAARGAALPVAGDAVHAELLLIGCEAFLSAGDVASAAPLVDELERIADDALAPWATCYRCQHTVYTDPARLPQVDELLQGAIDEFGRRSDPAGLAKAHRVRAGARGRLGRIGDCEQDLFDALIAARRSGDHRQITAALAAAPSAALWGPSPLPKAGGRCLDVVRMQRMTTAAPSLEATSMRHLAVLEMLRGRPDKARGMLADARQRVADLGLRHGLMETELLAGIIELLQREPVAAEPHFRAALEGLDALGVGADAGQAAALLAQSLLAQGRIDEADRYAAESERLAGHNLKTAIAWRAVRSEILSAQGRDDEAVAMARAAVAVAAGTDLVLDHAEACRALSRVLTAAGDGAGGRRARADAAALLAAKEVLLGSDESRRSAPAGVADGRFSATRRTDLRDDDAAVADAELRVAVSTPRLAVTNRAGRAATAAFGALCTADVDAVMAVMAEDFRYVDRRRLKSMPTDDRRTLRNSYQTLLTQYNRFDHRILAVRGERLVLLWSRCANDAGFETMHLHIYEVDAGGRIAVEIRFDEDDFEGAYRELERRHYATEGADHATAGRAVSESVIALNAGDYDRLLNELSTPDLRVENRNLSADRSAGELHGSLLEPDAMLPSARYWLAVVRFVSPTWCVTRFEREAVGPDGERYSWTRILVVGTQDGRLTTLGEFELDDESAAFRYAESNARVTAGRMAVRNRASAKALELTVALQNKDIDAAMACTADGYTYRDRRRLLGVPVASRAELRAAFELIVGQYDRIDGGVLAVRGDTLSLHWSNWSDSSGNRTGYLHLFELGDDGLLLSETRFDSDDFANAYRELEHRFYANEGALFGTVNGREAHYLAALDRGEFDRVFGELFSPDLRLDNRSSSAFPNRSRAELRASFEDLRASVASTRTWFSVVHWLSTRWAVVRFEREAVGHHGERFSWAWLHVTEWDGARVASICRFDLDDEDAAFAYAGERNRESGSRLSVTNRCAVTVDAMSRAPSARDVDTTFSHGGEAYEYDDRRNLGGDPIPGSAETRVAVERILAEYNSFDWRTLAVRGERLCLKSSRWIDDAGNEAGYLHVFESDDDGRLVREIRFDEDDFDSAYRELNRRYYAGEGADFARSGSVGVEWIAAVNRGDFDRAFGELFTDGVRVQNRSRAPFPNRSAAEARESFETLNSMVTSSRLWYSVECWLTPTLLVRRNERDAKGADGEDFSWSWLSVAEFCGNRISAVCSFDVEDEDAAFAHAAERLRHAAGSG